MSADLILLGRVFTAEADLPWAEGIAVRDGRVLAVGSADDIVAHKNAGTAVVEADGLICPAFHDGHIHVLEGSLFDLWVNLHDVDPSGYLPAVQQAVRGLPADAWVRGGGWSMSAFPNGNPDRRDLDAVVGSRPAYLTARDGHTAWVSSSALRAAGITAETPDPPGGRIERDALGQPQGTLHETAMKLVGRHLPAVTEQDWRAALALGQRHLHALGIVGWLDARLSQPMLEAYVAAECAGELSGWVTAALHWDPARGFEQLDELVAGRESAQGELVKASTIKVFVDGVVENATAALHHPYVGSHSHGLPLFDEHTLQKVFRVCVQQGFNIHVHAVGDAGTTLALNAFEHVRSDSLKLGLRHQICHLQVVADSDIERFAALDVSANIQALWACRDEQNISLCAPPLGPERFEQQYRFGDLERAGARLAFGSDWRVSTPDPLPQIEVAITRRPPGDRHTPELGTGQGLRLATCLAGFTREAAYVNGFERVSGVLQPGRSADIVILDSDPFAVDPHEIHKVTVQHTYFRGAQVYQR